MGDRWQIWVLEENIGNERKIQVTGIDSNTPAILFIVTKDLRMSRGGK